MFVSTFWDDLFRGRSAEVHPAMETKTATFVENHTVDKDYDYWRQGDTEQVWVIFEVDGKFYKKFGTMSSYGDVTWDGNCVEVKKATKTIEVWV